MDPKHSHGPDRIDYQEAPGDLTEVHAAIQREHPEPTAEVTPIPLWLTAICGVAICWAGAYFGMFHGGFRADVFDERASSPDLLFPVASKAGGTAEAAVAEVSLAQQGKSTFSALCVACHQASGLGLAGQFPPLVKSEWVLGSEKRLVAILLKGLAGPITVEGKQFNNAMPAWEGQLNDKKIAAVVTYIRSEWGNSAPEITPGKVAAARKEFASQTAPYTEAQLQQIPADATLQDAAGAAAPVAAKPAANAAPAAAGSGPAAGAAPAAGAPDLTALGKAQYMSICVPCHQPTGMGLPMVFPPLVKTEYVNGDPKRLAAIILKGINPPMTIDGKVYAASPMPGQEAALSDEKIAAVASYVRQSFGNSSPPLTPTLVKEVRTELAAKKTPWTEAELKAFVAMPATPTEVAPSPAAPVTPPVPAAQ